MRGCSGRKLSRGFRLTPPGGSEARPPHDGLRSDLDIERVVHRLRPFLRCDRAHTARGGDRRRLPFPVRDGGGGRTEVRRCASFRAHAGLLDLVVADPWLHMSGTTGWFISVADVSQSAGSRIRIASLPGPPAAVLGAHDAVLTRDGTPLFDHQYRTGEPLAPVRVE
ncbi:hypothetical protein EJC51_45870 [Streptomyces aquilus]|uniref:Htaa domain-containing protein n=1 Tax=Streptomyces aquilus TaxID=2548456 RepID=A0A3Q9C7K7_9ACTN|nr:HtaA domain-containing protein [Streptomyces aquilus]AZP22735.1 hypothetical protein EJC51_45870 [Streptomyces aquilus]